MRRIVKYLFRSVAALAVLFLTLWLSSEIIRILLGPWDEYHDELASC